MVIFFLDLHMEKTFNKKEEERERESRGGKGLQTGKWKSCRKTACVQLNMVAVVFGGT